MIWSVKASCFTLNNLVLNKTFHISIWLNNKKSKISISTKTYQLWLLWVYLLYNVVIKYVINSLWLGTCIGQETIFKVNHVCYWSIDRNTTVTLVVLRRPRAHWAALPVKRLFRGQDHPPIRREVLLPASYWSRKKAFAGLQFALF